MKSLLLKILKWKIQILAKLTLWRYKPIIIGITGSVGKTSTKEAIKTVLHSSKKVRSSLKSYNNELGLPITILGDWDLEGGIFFWLKVLAASFFRLLIKSKNYPEILILEYGIDRPGDMKYLLSIARPQIGIVTALGEVPVHVEFFAGPEGIAHEKAKLICQLPATGFGILNNDDSKVLEMKNLTRAHVLTFGFSPLSDIRIFNFSNNIDGDKASVSFKLSYGGSTVPVRIEDVLGKSSAYAAAAASVAGLISGMNLVRIADALSGFNSPQGRLKAIQGIKNTLIIDDTYNSSPIALHEALDVLNSLKAKRKIAVLGDMLEIGKYTLETHEEIGKLLAKEIDILITVGMRAKFIAESAEKNGMPKKNIFVFEHVYDAGKLLQEKIQKEDLILVKGSQAVRLEKIVKEVMAEPEKAPELLVRQNKEWLDKKGIYD